MLITEMEIRLSHTMPTEGNACRSSIFSFCVFARNKIIVVECKNYIFVFKPNVYVCKNCIVQCWPVGIDFVQRRSSGDCFPNLITLVPVYHCFVFHVSENCGRLTTVFTGPPCNLGFQ